MHEFSWSERRKPRNPNRIAGVSAGVRSWPYRWRREQQLLHFPWFFHFVSSFSPHSYSLPLPLFVYILPLQIYFIPFHFPSSYIFFFSCYVFILFINFHWLPFPASSCPPFLSAQWCVSFLCHLVGTVEWIRHAACVITVVLCRFGGDSGERRYKAEGESRTLNPEAGFLSSLPMKYLNAWTKKKQGCCRCCCWMACSQWLVTMKNVVHTCSG